MVTDTSTSPKNVYIIPPKKRYKGLFPWMKVYHRKCKTCKKYFNEGDEYTVSNNGRVFKHIDCIVSRRDNIGRLRKKNKEA